MPSGNRETVATVVLHQSHWQVVLSYVECWCLDPLLCFPCCPPRMRKGKPTASSLGPVNSAEGTPSGGRNREDFFLPSLS